VPHISHHEIQIAVTVYPCNNFSKIKTMDLDFSDTV